jgi:hypothetical protein
MVARNSGKLEWRDGYKDGETSSYARKYPVVYFTGRGFPERQSADWVAVEDLRLLDELRLRPSHVPFYGVVRAYLERRTLCQTFEVRLGRLDPPLSTSTTPSISENANP